MNRASTSRCVVSTNSRSVGRHVSRACSCGRSKDKARISWPNPDTTGTVLNNCLKAGQLVTMLVLGLHRGWQLLPG